LVGGGEKRQRSRKRRLGEKRMAAGIWKIIKGGRGRGVRNPASRYKCRTELK